MTAGGTAAVLRSCTLCSPVGERGWQADSWRIRVRPVPLCHILKIHVSLSTEQFLAKETSQNNFLTDLKALGLSQLLNVTG